MSELGAAKRTCGRDLQSWPPRPETQRCPFDFYEKLRERAPVYRFPTPAPDGRPIFLVTGWEEAAYVLTHRAEFDSDLVGLLPEIEFLNPPPRPEPTSYTPQRIAFSEGEDHKAKRSWALALFTRSRLREAETLSTEVADALIDDFIDDGECDFRTAFADLLPLNVLTALMGLPREDGEKVKQWTDTVTGIGLNGNPTDEQAATVRIAVAESFDYATRELSKRIAEPRDDYLTDVLRMQMERDGSFDPNALGTHVRVMLGAAYHTSAAMLTNAVVHLCTTPGLQTLVRGDRSLIPPLIEESMRHESPLQHAPRRCVVDTVLGGVDVPSGALLFISFAAANRDARTYPNPHAFELNRPQITHHLAFGRGSHRCPGAPLARVQGQIGLSCLLDRIDDIRVVAEGTDLAPLPGFPFRIPASLRIRFTARDAPAA